MNEMQSKAEEEESPVFCQNFLKWDCKLVPEEIWVKASEELHETRERKENCLLELRLMLKEDNGAQQSVDDAFLIQFLRAKKFDCEKAFRQAKKFLLHKQKYPKLYIPNLEASEESFLYNLPYRSPLGCGIFVLRLSFWDPDSVSFEEFVRVCYTYVQKACENVITQICGLVMICDCQGFTWKQLTSVKPSLLRGVISGIQDCFPVRLKGCHIIYNPLIFSFLFSIVRPLLSKKISNRVHFHGSDMNSLEQHIPRVILPSKYHSVLAQNPEYQQVLTK